jgi:hypothetical protein
LTGDVPIVDNQDLADDTAIIRGLGGNIDL